jgi:type IV pilus assembly protein PilY1
MVQSFGSQRPGYFALDVTHPTIPETTDTSKGPKFLWQLTTDSAGQPLFGKGGSTPAITTLYIGGKQVPVAVLPGGRGDPVGPGACDKDMGAPLPLATDGTPGGPQNLSDYRTNKICDYPNASGSLASTAARSVTIVRLDTGAIVRTFRPNGVTLPAGIDSDVVIDTTRDQDGSVVPLRIPAPIVGQPVAFPAQVGQIADRIFVGDAEGVLWRIDVSSDDPDDWVMNVFFDAYWDGGPNASPFVQPQPIQTPPILSVDDKGQITVAYSTGDQDNLVPDASHKNYVVSVTEVFDRSSAVKSDGSRKYAARLNWREELVGGERVLGPMTLFNRTLYFATYKQNDGADGCSDPGVSRVLSLNYVKPEDKGDAREGGFPDRAPIENIAGVVAGVGLRQLPSCGSTLSQEDNTDEFLGYGQYTTSTTASTPGKFQLVIQLGGGTGTSTTGTVPTQVVDLEPPANTVRIDSWAPIVE